MEDLTHLQLSQKAYKAHVTRIFKKVEELMALDTLDELQMSSLKFAQIVEQITTPEGLGQHHWYLLLHQLSHNLLAHLSQSQLLFVLRRSHKSPL